MYTKQELERLTVLQLRKVAKEHHVTLGAGIDKAGIIQKICIGCDIPLQEKPVTEQLTMDTPSVSFDVTSSPKKPYSPHDSKRRSHSSAAPNASAGLTVPIPSEPQTTSVSSVIPTTQTPSTVPIQQSIQTRPIFRPQQPLGSTKRFGPRNQADIEATEKGSTPSNTIPEPKSKETLVTSDGFRLSYRAQPARGSRTDYREGQDTHSRYPYQRRTIAPTPTEDHFHDDLYQMSHDVEFDLQVEEGILPFWLRCENGESIKGRLEIMPEGYGFLRDCGQPVYVSQAQIKRFGLNIDDIIQGKVLLVKADDPYPVLLYIEKLNDKDIQSTEKRASFEQLDAIYPNRRISLDASSKDHFVRLMDLMAPIGFGQRGLIIAPPDSGSLVVLRECCKTIQKNDPDAVIFMLLIDIPAEEVTEMKKAVNAEIFSSAFGDPPENQTRASELMLDRAQRAALEGKNVVILLDSLNKLIRAYQNQISKGNRPIANVVTPSALIRPKHLFGMAKNTENSGSLTVIAVLQIETGSRIDDIIYEEFKGTANMVLTLCSAKADDPLFPMINLEKTGTRRDDLILSEEERKNIRQIQSIFIGENNENTVAQLVDMIKKTKSNQDLMQKLPGWLAFLEQQS